MNNIIAHIRTQLQKLKCRIANLSNRVTYIENNCCNGGGDIGDVSATEPGIVNNTPLQELGGVDKLINGVRIGRGSGNNEDNVIVGKDALSTNTTGTYNTAFGGWVLTENTTGSFNSSFGSGALNSNTTGMYNNAFGTSTLQNNTTGSRNIGVGTSLFWNSTGQENTGVGSNAGYGATTGSQNTYIGNQAGYNNGIGSYNTAIGSRAMITSGTGIPASTLDMNRNVFIGVGLTLVDGVNDVLAIDNKGATNTFYSNALLYGNFADRFLRINGRFEIDDATMPTADAGFTKKLVWNPTTGVVGETDDTGSGDFIPLTGTEVGSPVTGDVEFVNGLYGGILRFQGGDGSSYDVAVYTNFDNFVIDAGNNLIDIRTDGESFYMSSRGFEATSYFAPIHDNFYIQKKYVDDANSYSTTETLTGGTWIDGKPIYRRVIEYSDMNYVDGSDGMIEDISGAYETIINIGGFFEAENDTSPPVTKVKYSVFSNEITVYEIHENNDDFINLKNNSGFTIESGVLILEYTKNTD